MHLIHIKERGIQRHGEDSTFAGRSGDMAMLWCHIDLADLERRQRDWRER